MENKPRLFYLGFAFPPGLGAVHPEINPAGNGFETQMTQALRTHLDIRSAGTLPFRVAEIPAGADPDSGVAHELLLVEKSPELWHRLVALRRLKRQYLRWRAAGWRPDLVMTYNLSPVYNAFVRWLRAQADRPKLVLLFLDSSHLGQRLPAFKRFRYRFKPLAVPDAEMIGAFDGCIGLSQSAGQFFLRRKIPFLWLPGGCTPQRAVSKSRTEPPVADDSPIRFGYFGALAEHSGIRPLVETFLAGALPGPLHICGHGKLGAELAERARRDPRLRFHGLLPTAEACLGWAAEHCDVLVNPRPASHGNENNFPSKIFEYALCGRAILTSRLAGVDEVLGPEAFYFDPRNFTGGLAEQLSRLSLTPRAELNRRGTALRERIISRYSWPRQAEAMAEFAVSLTHA